MVYLIFFVLLVGGSIALEKYGVLALIANGFFAGGFMLVMAYWKGEPQSMRVES